MPKKLKHYSFFARFSKHIKETIVEFFGCHAAWDLSDAELIASKLVRQVCKDVEETAGEDYTSEDVYIAIRRCIMRKYKLLDA